MTIDLLNPYQMSIGDLCKQVLKETGAVGVGQTPLAEDINDTWLRLQFMLQQWQVKRWLVYHLKNYSIVSTGAQSYTFGPNGQINTSVVSAYGVGDLEVKTAGAGYLVGDTVDLALGPGYAPGGTEPQITVTTVSGPGGITGFSISAPGAVPGPLPTEFSQDTTSGVGLGAVFNYPTWQLLDNPVKRASGGASPRKLESAFLRQLQLGQPNQVDYSMEILQSMEDYNRIALKALVSFPGAVFLDSNWPMSQIFFYPVPQAAVYSINCCVMEQLPTSFANLDEVVNLPLEYYNCILFNLALRCRPRYSITTYAGDMLPGLAKDALNTVRGPNTQIARLTLPTDLTRPGIYNIFSDQNY